MIKVYLAAGWFNEEQEKVRQLLLKMLKNSGVDFYSPKEDNLWEPGRDPNQAFEDNIMQLNVCDVVLAYPGSEHGNRDTGTVFECGYAYSLHKPTIYYWPSLTSVNLMLAQSAHLVSRNIAFIKQYLVKASMTNEFPRMPFKGSIE